MNDIFTIAQYLQQRLSDDPALAGLKVEVINAAVNFNRIVEVSAAYIAEWVFWNPDLVLVFGSANNVGGRLPPKDLIQERVFNIQSSHPWLVEHERTVMPPVGRFS